MSNGDSGKRSEAWLVVALASATIIGGFIYWDAASRQTASEIEAEVRSVGYANTAREELTSTCIANELSAEECSEKAEETYRPKQRDELDLSAQQTMAAWTRAMGLAALVGMGVGIFGLGLIWRTWDATRQAASNSRETLNAYIAKERGYVEATGAEYIDVSPEPLRPGVIINLRNVGLSPLEIFAINYKLVPQGTWDPDGMSTLARRKLIPAGEDREIGALIFTEFSEGWLNGSVEYTTLKNQKFKAYFCFNVAWQEMGGYRPDRWSITQVYPPAMPSNF
ncbi:hypothetical protein [Qipengyuania gaetbuli]|uniref:hypothetical protein n=1 Tax=Qipengyuania gaetbuli TaxID=266952 RepID=UPI001CFDCCBD|nr:hypothetical protein [Qipengyuania gaetbuli]